VSIPPPFWCQLKLDCNVNVFVQRRKGSALVVVLFVIGLTMTLSYAMIRMQHSVATIHVNSELAGNARQASMSACSIAIKKIQDGTWSGLGTTQTASLGNNTTYSITYAAGDSSLSVGHPDWDDNPYRITITVTGEASDQGGNGVVSQHAQQIVVRLVPEELNDVPSDWATFQNYTLYQTGTGKINIDLPSQLAGAIKLQGDVVLPRHYPTSQVKEDDELLFVAANASALTSQEKKRTDALDGWGFNVHLISDDSSAASYNSWKSLCEVVYVSEEASSLQIGNKLTNFQIGVVNEDRTMYGELGASDDGWNALEKWSWVIDNSHYITSPFSLGNLQFHNSSEVGNYLGANRAEDLRILMQWDQGSKDCLAILYPGSTIDSSSNDYAAGRRVILPFGGDDYKFNKIYDDGLEIVERSVKWAATHDPQERFLRDLAAQSFSSSNDYRPFTGTVNLDYSSLANSDQVEEMLEDWLGLTVNDVPATLPSVDWVLPLTATTYRIYEGGPEYSVQQLTSISLVANLAPDPATNPLGIFYRDGDLDVDASVSIEGTLIVTKKLRVNAANVILSPHDIAPLNGTNSTTRLPTIVCKDLEIAENANASTTGLVAVFNDIVVKKGGASSVSDITGRLIFDNQFDVAEHTSWKDLNYNDLWYTFRSQSTYIRFSEYLASTLSLSLSPRFSLQPDVSSVTYHWNALTTGEPVFVKPTGSGGLRFQIIRWGAE
jgi:hypothetical protein